MNIKVISLKESIDRREKFELLNSHLNFKFFDAIDGRKIPNLDIFEPDLNYTSGAKGCALSHLILWNEVIDTNEPLTIMEDDVIVHKNFYSKQNELLKEVSDDWDIIVWGYNFSSPIQFKISPNLPNMTLFFSENLQDENYEIFQNKQFKLSLYKLIMSYGTSCYSISPIGAKKFKELCFPLRNFEKNINFFNKEVILRNVGIDITLLNYYEETNSYLCFPPMSIPENNILNSTVQNTL